MVTVKLTRPVNLQLDDGSTVRYGAGEQEIPDDHADHWYVKAHIEGAAAPKLVPGTPEYAAIRRAEAELALKEAQRLAELADQADDAARAAMEELEMTRTNARIANDAANALAEEGKKTTTRLQLKTRE